MSDVKEEEVVNRITKLAAELHFSGDRSSISGMKGNKLVMENMDYKKRSWPPSLPRWAKTFSIPLENFDFYDLCIQRVLKTPVDWYNWKEQGDDDDDDDRNIYLRNEYL